MWFKVDDKLHDHPKVQRLLETGDGAALGLWLLAGSWSGDQLSDGLVPMFVMGRWCVPDWQRLATRLCEVGLWTSEDVDGRPHYRFHDWTDYNDPREKILADREAERMRVALIRDVRLVTAIK
ncbi:MAG: hypothetical protein JWQ74_1073, partial [Marmoricola sp.]|nr:hypothetical protein [Marmoricola sp.]